MKSILKSHWFGIFVSILAENRLIPKIILKHRTATRIRFIKMWVPKSGIGAEIGVQKGFFSHALLHHTAPERLHLIDPWYLLGEVWPWATGSKSTGKALANIIHWFIKELASKKVVLHIGFDEDVLEEFPDNYFDWVYLDTSHTYSDTKRELQILQRKVKTDGIILGDDWFSDVNHEFYGQYRAVTEFLAEASYQILAASDDDHQWAISRVRS